MALITARLDGVVGRIQSAHLEIEISGKRLEDFKNMDIEDQIEYLEEEADFWPDDFSYEFDKITRVTIQE